MNVCRIVEDLLPLYIEELTCEETGSFVKEHLDGCENCRNLHRRMTMPVQQEAQKVDYRKTLWKDVLKIVGQVLLGIAAVVGLFMYYLWESGWLDRKVIESPDGQQRFVEYDTAAGFFGSGAYIETPDGRGIILQGDESYRDFDAWFSPDSQGYFVWIEFEDRDKAYIVIDKEAESGIYEKKEIPDVFRKLAAALVEESYLAEGTPVTFSFRNWSEDSRYIWFDFETEYGVRGAVLFDCGEERVCGMIEYDPLFDIIE